MSLRQFTQFVRSIHRTSPHFRHRRNGNEPPEFLERSFIFDLQQHVLASGVVQDDSFLCRLVDVDSLVPFENEATICYRRQNQKSRHGGEKDNKQESATPCDEKAIDHPILDVIRTSTEARIAKLRTYRKQILTTPDRIKQMTRMRVLAQREL